ncbi:LysM peptidoglycan-binding domain-containing protein [Undibacterium sp. Rencai35W]|uniref:LysM peptidoglycan-binding domain-containing protein n=1 Tax=Undibacterium sp. Rencai35W TaxID=3413046 RepID=UPI003BF15C8E
MKKFSTIALLIAVAFPVMASSQAFAQEAVNAAKAGKCTFLPDAPDKHVVVKGDTLWDISAKFLSNPWCWPEVWGMNRDEIRNPHWIYPNQIVYFDRVNGRLRLGQAVGGSGADGSAKDGGRLQPQVRTEDTGKNAITAIPSNLIEPFLSQPLVIEKDTLLTAPRIVATQEGRVILAKSDKAYVRGDLKGGTSFQVFRPGVPLKDPENNTVIGYEAVYLGTLKLERTAKTPDGVDSFIVASAKEEMAVGDRLMPIPPTPIQNYVPHPPERDVRARIVSIYGGVSQAGQNQVVSINKGASAGLNIGTVLELSRYGKIIQDKTDEKKPIRLPDEHYGSLFIFRVFDNISYGLIMTVTDTVAVGDLATSPE